MAKQINELAHHHPSSAEIQQKRSAVNEHIGSLRNQGAALYSARKGTPPASKLTDHDRRVSTYIQRFFNGSTPPQALVPGVLREEEICAELAALRFVDAELGRQYDDALEREANEWVQKNKDKWRLVCRKICLCAIRLASLEERARNMLEAKPQWPVPGLAMGSTIGSTSILGFGNSLLDLRTAALNEGVLTLREVAEAASGG